MYKGFNLKTELGGISHDIKKCNDCKIGKILFDKDKKIFVKVWINILE